MRGKAERCKKESLATFSAGKLDELLIATIVGQFRASSPPIEIVASRSVRSRSRSLELRDHAMNHISMHIGQPEVSTGDLVRQLQVIQPKKM